MADSFDPERLTSLPIEYGFVSIGVPGRIGTTYLTDNGRIVFHGANEIDEQGTKGKNLGRPKHQRVKLAEVTIGFNVMPDEEVHFWTKVYPFLREKGKRGNAPPIELYNSQVQYSGITTVMVADYNIGEANNRDGREVTIKFKEWSPAPVKKKEDASLKNKKTPPSGVDPEVNIFD